MTDDDEDDRVTIERRTLERLLDVMDQFSVEVGALAKQIRTRRRVSRKCVDRLDGLAGAARWAIAEARPPRTIH